MGTPDSFPPTHHHRPRVPSLDGVAKNRDANVDAKKKKKKPPKKPIAKKKVTPPAEVVTPSTAPAKVQAQRQTARQAAIKAAKAELAKRKGAKKAGGARKKR